MEAEGVEEKEIIFFRNKNGKDTITNQSVRENIWLTDKQYVLINKSEKGIKVYDKRTII